MKEATGAANMTVITIVLIGVVAVIGLMLVPRLMKNGRKEACCTDAAGIWSKNSCIPASGIEFDEKSYSKCIAE